MYQNDEDIVQRKQRELIETLKLSLRKKNLELEAAVQEVQQLTQQLQEYQQAHNNNLNVIQELQEQNAHIKAKALEFKKLSEAKTRELQTVDNQLQIKGKTHTMELEHLKKQVQRLRRELEQANDKLKQKTDADKKIEELQFKHKIQIEQISDMAAAKIKKEEAHFTKSLNSYKQQTEAITAQLKSRNQGLADENLKLQQQINVLKQDLFQKETRFTEDKIGLQRNLKDAEYTRQVYESELANTKKCNEEWEASLRQKVRVLQLQKEAVLEQFSEYKLKRKDKTKQLKEEFSGRLTAAVEEYDQKQRKCESVLRHLKLENEKLEYTVGQLRKQVQEQDRHTKNQVVEAEHKHDFLLRNLEEDKKALRNEVAFKEIKVGELTDQVSQLNLQLLQQKSLVQKLHETIIMRNKQLEQLRNQKDALQAKMVKITANTNNKNQNNIEISRGTQNISEDMVEFNDDWLMRRQSSQVKPHNSIRQAFDNKKIEALQNQNYELKSEIGNMDKRMREAHTLFNEKLDLKDQELKLLRNQVYLHKDKINAKEAELIKMQQKLQSAEFEATKLRDSHGALQKELSIIGQLKKHIQELTAELQAVRSDLAQVEQERDVLLQISNQQRAELRELQFNPIASTLTQIVAPEPEPDLPDFPRPISPINKKDTVPKLQPQQPQQARQRTQTLTNLIKQRRQLANADRQTLQVRGGQARLQERERDVRGWAAETDSQRRVYEAIRKKSKQRAESPIRQA